MSDDDLPPTEDAQPDLFVSDIDQSEIIVVQKVAENLLSQQVDDNDKEAINTAIATASEDPIVINSAKSTPTASAVSSRNSSQVSTDSPDIDVDNDIFVPDTRIIVSEIYNNFTNIFKSNAFKAILCGVSFKFIDTLPVVEVIPEANEVVLPFIEEFSGLKGYKFALFSIYGIIAASLTPVVLMSDKPEDLNHVTKVIVDLVVKTVRRVHIPTRIVVTFVMAIVRSIGQSQIMIKNIIDEANLQLEAADKILEGENCNIGKRARDDDDQRGGKRSKKRKANKKKSSKRKTNKKRKSHKRRK